MPEQQQAKFEGWAIVEVMGHQRYAGFVTTEVYGQAALFRIDVPALQEREYALQNPGYVGCEWFAAGTKVRREPAPGYSKLVGAGSIYAITPCSEEAALQAVESIQQRPLKVIELPAKALPEPAESEQEEGLAF